MYCRIGKKPAVSICIARIDTEQLRHVRSTHACAQAPAAWLHCLGLGARLGADGP